MARIGIVGTGWGARVQVPTFREAGLEVTGIAGQRPERTRAVADDLGVRPYDDWRELIAAPDVELVSIVTPPSEHREMALAALDAGKHVLLEKPTALHAGEAEELVEAAKRHPGRIALIDHELRFLPSWREARTRLAELGPIRYAEVRYSSPARGDRKREWNWWSDASRGGGIWGAVGSHFVDALRFFGVEFEEVQALMRTTIERRPVPRGSSGSSGSSGGAASESVTPRNSEEPRGTPWNSDTDTREVTSDDFASVDLRCRGGAVAVMTFSAVSTGPDETSVLTIYAEEGAIRFIGEEVLLSTGRAPFARMAGAANEERPGNSHGGAFGSGTLYLARALREALDSGNRDALAPGATFEDGLMQQRVLDAARASASRGGWVRV
ncbi:MAG TPA: Gfo/Idh/MocA family oxidoreductase [Thermoanaerobaculia bacterium]|jgi:predicted dehydrogenase